MKGYPPSWTSRALCLGQPVDVFFPIQGSTLTRHRAVASRWCIRCPVLDACRQHIEGFQVTDRWGIWAGRLYRGGREPLALLEHDDMKEAG